MQFSYDLGHSCVDFYTKKIFEMTLPEMYQMLFIETEDRSLHSKNTLPIRRETLLNHRGPHPVSALLYGPLNTFVEPCAVFGAQ